MIQLTRDRCSCCGDFRVKWSGRLDSNQRPPAPKAGALPGCATPRLIRHYPTPSFRSRFRRYSSRSASASRRCTFGQSAGLMRPMINLPACASRPDEPMASSLTSSRFDTPVVLALRAVSIASSRAVDYPRSRSMPGRREDRAHADVLRRRADGTHRCTTTNSDPQNTMICALDGSSMLTVLHKLWGHASTGPRGDFDQSSARIRAPISPPPRRNARFERAMEELSVMCELSRTLCAANRLQPHGLLRDAWVDLF